MQLGLYMSQICHSFRFSSFFANIAKNYKVFSLERSYLIVTPSEPARAIHVPFRHKLKPSKTLAWLIMACSYVAAPLRISPWSSENEENAFDNMTDYEFR